MKPAVLPGLFDVPVSPVIGPRPGTVAPATRKRVSLQCRVILERLQHGPVSNTELAKLALKYTGRLSELRQAGYPVKVKSHDRVTGVVFYELG